jgi:hypothetical protein
MSGGAECTRRPLSLLQRPYIGVSIGVLPLTLLLGQGGDEFAAEIGDVGDHTAPDRVGGLREGGRTSSTGFSSGSFWIAPPAAGVVAGVCCQ